MKILILLFIFFFGLAVGSFLNCIIYRLENKESFLRKRSHCPQCNHILSWKDLIPVFSFLMLKGKCRYCQKRISLQYPLVELATASIFVLVYNYSLSNLQFAILNLIISCFLIVIFVFDLKHYLIPDKLIHSAILGIGIWHLVFLVLGNYTIYDIRNTIYSAFGAAGFFLIIYLISRGKWLGFGDVELVFLIGLFLGWPKILIALFFSFFTGAIVGLILIFFGKKTMKSEIPFAPFLVSGTFFALFFSQQIINWYLNFLLI